MGPHCAFSGFLREFDTFAGNPLLFLIRFGGILVDFGDF